MVSIRGRETGRYHTDRRTHAHTHAHTTSTAGDLEGLDILRFPNLMHKCLELVDPLLQCEHVVQLRLQRGSAVCQLSAETNSGEEVCASACARVRGGKGRSGVVEHRRATLTPLTLVGRATSGNSCAHLQNRGRQQEATPRQKQIVTFGGSSRSVCDRGP